MTALSGQPGQAHGHAEALVAIRLGASAADAVAVIERLVAEDMLAHGTATIAAAAASRWGTEPAAALQALAAGRRLGAAFSAYELRTAAEEAEAELQVSPAADPAPSTTLSDLLMKRGVAEVTVDASEHHRGPGEPNQFG